MTLEVAAATHAINIQAGFFGGVVVSVIDIDRKKRQRALLVRTRHGDGEDPPYDGELVFYLQKTLRPHTFADGAKRSVGNATSNGKSIVTVHYTESCFESTIVRYRVRGYVLTEIGRRTIKGRLEDCSG